MFWRDTGAAVATVRASRVSRRPPDRTEWKKAEQHPKELKTAALADMQSEKAEKDFILVGFNRLEATKRRRRIKYFTKRRAPIAPAEFVEQMNQTVRGWVNYFRHTNASQAFRSLQRFINTRFAGT